MNKVKMIKVEVKELGMELGDIYQRSGSGQSESYPSYYICCIDLEEGSARALFSLQKGHRWSSYSGCLRSIREGTFTKLEKGSKIEIEVC